MVHYVTYIYGNLYITKNEQTYKKKVYKYRHIVNLASVKDAS